MTDFLTALQYVTADGKELVGRDGVNYFVRTSAENDDDYFEDTENQLEGTNEIYIDKSRFAGNDIKKLQLHYESGLLTDSLTVDTVTIELTSAEPIVITRYTPITVKRAGRVMGVFFNGQVENIGLNLYSVYAESYITLLDYDYHNGGMYNGETTGNIVAELMGNVPYTINPDVADVKIYGYLPRDTRRKNLQQILIAVGAAVTKENDGTIKITVLSKQETGVLSPDRVFSGGKLNTATQTTALQVTEHSYSTADEETILFDESLTDDVLVTFPEPMHSLVCTNGTILESSANHAKIRGNGMVQLTGKKYTHITRVITRGEITGQPDDKIYTVTDATLIGVMNSSSVANRLYNYIQCNQTIQQDVLIAAERTGDTVQVVHPHSGELVKAAIQTLDFNLSNTLRAAGTFLVGYVPAGISSGYKNRILITEDGTFVVPADVTELRVVVISGGDAGSPGASGSEGAGGRNQSNLSAVGTAAGGKGGIGGDGGKGGKIFDTVIKVTPGQEVTVAIGKGGVAGGSDPEKTGTKTVFGKIDSSSGAAGGFVDQFTGDEFAATGPKGRDGGKGAAEATYIKCGDIIYNEGKHGEESGISGGSAGFRVFAYGGGGGGPAIGSHGGNGGNGRTSYNNGNYFAESGNGGKGADALPGADAVIYGCGGQGGHGGGGGGGSGDVYQPNGSNYLWIGSPGAGGRGGAGGNGAPGCVIVYY